MNIDNEFINMENILKEYFPYSPYLKKFNTSECIDLFYSMHDNLKFVNLVLDFELISNQSDLYSLLYEYKIFSTKLFTALALNDSFLISSICRLILENFYRILYGISFSDSTYNSIRKKSRFKMSDRITKEKNLDISELDLLYKKYSEDIHYTKKNSKKLSSIIETINDENLIDYLELQESINEINKSWINFILIPFLEGSEVYKNLNITSLKKFIKNNISDKSSKDLIKTIDNNSKTY